MKKQLLLLIVLIFLISGIVLWRDIYLPVSPGSTQTIDFLIQKGEGAKEISINLKKDGLIRHTSIFRAYVLIKRVSKKLQAGQYRLSPAMNMQTIVYKIVSGEIVKKKITIIEGWNLKDIGEYLENQGIAEKKEFFALTGYPAEFYSDSDLPSPKDFGGEFDFLAGKSKKVSLEGYLFPDTYEISFGDNVEDIVRKMLVNFGNKLSDDLRAEINNQGKTICQVITMASLIEKEVRTLEDKKIVSGIFWKRIKTGKPLQSCATINYITGKNDRGALLEDIEIDSPYNTYKYYGLPLGPISNPALDSILAAIYPRETDYLYYLSTPEGKTIFSKTLKEHNAAKAKYLK